MTDRRAVTVPPSLAKLAAVSWRVLVVGTAAWVIVLLLVELRVVFFPVFISLLLATLLAPAAAALRSRGWSRLLAAWAVLLGFLVFLGAAIAFLAPQVAGELNDVGTSVREGMESLLASLAEGPLELSRSDVDRYLDRALQRLQENSSAIAGGVISGAVLVGEIIAGILLTLVLLFFFVKDGDQMFRWLIDHLPEAQRGHARAMAESAWGALSAYVRGTALVAFVDAVLIGIALLLIGVPLVPALMVLTFLGGFFPLVGAVFAGFVAALVALVSGGLIDALLVVGVVTLIQQLEGDLLQPVLVGRVVKLHPIVVLLSLTAGAVLAGIAGAFLAVPVTAAATAIGSYLYRRGNSVVADASEGTPQRAVEGGGP